MSAEAPPISKTQEPKPWPLWIALVPWITLYVVELPSAAWSWGFGLSKHGPLGLLVPLLVYLGCGILATVLGLLLGKLLKTARNPGGMGLWLFLWNVGIAWGILALGLWLHQLLFGLPSNAPAKASIAAALGILLAFALGGVLVLLANRRSPRSMAAVAIIATLLVTILMGAQHAPTVGGNAQRPNVLLITIDTCNLSRLSTYGYALDTTPNLTRIAQEGAKFTQAYSHIGLTGPSHGSLFTGLHPQASKVYDNAIPFPFSAKTIAEQFRANNYFTAGIPGNVVMQERYAFHQGFDRYPQRSAENGLRALQWERILLFRALRRMWGIEPEAILPGRLRTMVWGKEARPSIFIHEAEYQNAHALEAVSYAGKRNWFMWLHYFDAHAPYEADGQDLLQPLTSGSEQLKGLGSINGLFNLSYIGLQPLYGNCFLQEHKVKPVVATADEIEDLRRIYDAQLKHIDDSLGILMEELQARGELENTLVILTADHGEALFTRGYFGHSYFLHQDEMHVPLIMWWPGKIAPRVIDTPVALTDIAPTICDLSGVEPIDTWSGTQARYAGRSLAPLLQGESGDYPPVYLIRFDHARGVVTPEAEKLIYHAVDGVTPFAARPWHGSQWLWYDTLADPDEVVNLAADAPQGLSEESYQRFNQLQGALDARARELDGTQVADINYQSYLAAILTPKQLEMMKSLGYLQGSGGGKGTLSEAACEQPVDYTRQARSWLESGRMSPVPHPPPP